MNIPELVSDGKIFSITFIKRTTGLSRTMCARRGVTRHLVGGALSYNPSDHGLMTVFDLEKRAYRTVPLDAVISLQHHGKTEMIDG